MTCTDGNQSGKASPFFFILSRPRTGSTLLRTLLDAHPQAVVPPECQFILNLQPRFGRIRHWSERDIRALVRELPKQYLFDTWKMDLDRLESELLPLAGRTSYAALCRHIYLRYPSLFRKDRIRAIGDKNPGYALHPERLLELFPEAHFIHLYRDYRDNHLSLADAGFELPLISLTTAKWRYFFNRVSKFARHHPGRVLAVRYEDLASQPETTLRRICDFLALPWHPAMLDFHDKREEMLHLYREAGFLRFHGQLMKPVSTDRVGLWTSRLDERQVRVADFVAGEYAEMAGYRRRYRDVGPQTALRALPGILLARANYLARGVVDRLPWQLRQQVLIRVTARIEALWRKLFPRRRSGG